MAAVARALGVQQHLVPKRVLGKIATVFKSEQTPKSPGLAASPRRVQSSKPPLSALKIIQLKSSKLKTLIV